LTVVNRYEIVILFRTDVGQGYPNENLHQ